MDAVQSGNFACARALLSPDFQFSGQMPPPVNADAWLGINATMLKAFPDLDYHFKIEGEQSNVVDVSTQLAGTHHGDLDLTPLGRPVYPASHKSFTAAPVRAKATVSDGKVVSWVVEPTEGAGVSAIVEQLAWLNFQPAAKLAACGWFL